MHHPSEETHAQFERDCKALPTEEICLITDLQPYKNNASTHSKKQLRQIADSIERFGFANPVLVTGDNMNIAGHGRVEAAKLLGMVEVPVRRLGHLNKDEVRAYTLANNRIPENAGWDKALLALEFDAMLKFDFDSELLGFSAAEIDRMIEEFGTGGDPANLANEYAAVKPHPVFDKTETVASGTAITQAGDLWQFGPHRLLCGDARSMVDVAKVCGDETAELIFTDPPYNVKIDGHIIGSYQKPAGQMGRTGTLHQSTGAINRQQSPPHILK